MFKLEAMPRGDRKTKDLFTVLSNAYFSIVSPISSLREVCAFVRALSPLGLLNAMSLGICPVDKCLYTRPAMTISLFIHTCHSRQVQVGPNAVFEQLRGLFQHRI